MFDQWKMNNQGQLKQEDDLESEQHSSASRMPEPWKEVEVAAAQDAMAGDSDNEMEGMITAAQNTMEEDLEDQTKVKLDAKELVMSLRLTHW
jgi:hypothetical protein